MRCCLAPTVPIPFRGACCGCRWERLSLCRLSKRTIWKPNWRRWPTQWGCQRWATVLDASAEPLAGLVRPARLALLLGSEGHGLGSRWIAHCDRQVTIPMRPGTDSLNVAVATGIFLYQLGQMAN